MESEDRIYEMGSEGWVNPVRWAIMGLAVIYRLILFWHLRAGGFFDLGFVDSRAYLDLASSLTRNELPSPLFKSALWFVHMEALVFSSGLGLMALHLIQYLGGILLVLTVLTLGKRVFGSVPSLLAGGALAVYGPILFQESQLVPAIWAALFFTCSVLLATAPSTNRPLFFFLSGLLMGVGVQSRPNMILAAVFLFITLLFQYRSLNLRSKPMVFMAGLILSLAPLTIHNARSGEFIPVSAGSGINFFIGNGPHADGAFELPRGYFLVNEGTLFGPSTLEYPKRALGYDPGYREASSFWLMLALKSMIDDPKGSVSLFGKKLLLSVQAWEISNNFSYWFFSKVLMPFIPPLDFGILFSFAVPGILVSFRQKVRKPLLWATAGYFISVIVFFVVDRYRVPVVPLAALLAGVGVVEICSCIRSGGLRKGAFLLLCVITLLPITHIQGWTSVDIEMADSWTFISKERFSRGDEHGTRLALEEALRAVPEYRPAIVALGSLEAIQGNLDMAEDLYKQALKIMPDDSEVLGYLGRVYVAKGEYEEGLRQFQRGLAVTSGDSSLYADAIRALVKMHRLDRAVEMVRDAESAGSISNEEILHLRGLIPRTKGDPGGTVDAN